MNGNDKHDDDDVVERKVDLQQNDAPETQKEVTD